MLDIVASYHLMQFQVNLFQIFFFFFFFIKNLASSATRYGQPSSCKISRKTSDPFLKKISDGQTDGRESFHRTLSDKRRASSQKNPSDVCFYSVYILQLKFTVNCFETEHEHIRLHKHCNIRYFFPLYSFYLKVFL